MFSQFPIIHTVDLRGVSDPADVTSSLSLASGHGCVTNLILYKSAVRDQHLANVKSEFPDLTCLKINDTQIGDSGIAHLSGHPTLQHINVQRTAITDASVPVLSTFPRLKELNVGETKITSFQQLRELLSSCYVTNKLVTRSQTTDRYRTGSGSVTS